MNSTITLSHSYILKGIALIFLLVHHLFSIQEGFYLDLELWGIKIIQNIGIASKVCVAIFVFLSGYGLTQKYSKENHKIDLHKYYITRFSKLMINYWFIGIIFVTIGILFFDRTPHMVYEDNLLIKGLIDFLGLANCFGTSSYNVTWWFISCIVILYILFPLFHHLSDTKLLIITVLSIITLNFPWYLFSPIRYFLTTFLIGIIYARKERIIQDMINHINRYIFLVSFIVLFACRNQVTYALLFDNLLTVNLVILVLKFKINNKSLYFLGKHSMNIFLFHTFIYYYYFNNLIFWSNNPLIIFSTLMIVCIIISMLLDKLKDITGLNSLILRIKS